MFADLLIILSTSLILIALLRRLRLPPLLGYLGVGLLIGPQALGWVEHLGEKAPLLGELGVVFLLFSLGLEFSLPRLLAMRRTVFGLGALQVVACTLPLAGLFMLLQVPPGIALLLGAGLSLSSTAIVSKELTSLGELFSSHGQNAIGVLLFQDLVAVLLLTLVPVFAGHEAQAWQLALPLTLGKALLLFFGLLIISRSLLPRLFHEVASARSAELFMLLALVIVLLTAWLTHLLGLSMALGAFLAGMLLGESHYRHQIEADIRPFRDVLLGLFFVSVGMLIDLRLFTSKGLEIAALTLILLACKGLIVTLLVKWRGADWTTAWRSGLALAQGGEFFFALLAQMQAQGSVPSTGANVLLAATFCSMALTPLLLRLAPGLANRLQRFGAQRSAASLSRQGSLPLQDHVLICGYGRVGQSIARFLAREQIPFVALDDDPVRVREASAGEDQVHYGDSRRADLLRAMNIARARLLVIAVDNPEAAEAIVRQARQLNSTVPILVRTRDDSRLPELQQLGASEVVPEVLESSLMLAAHTLVMLGIPAARVQQHTDEVRHNRYRLLQGFYHGGQISSLEADGAPRRLLHAVPLNEQAYACGRTLSDLQLQSQFAVEVQGLRRNGEERQPDEQPLSSSDTLLLVGQLAALEAAERYLLAGR